MMRKRRLFARRRGFTLLEALMTATLLGLCAAGVTQTWCFCYALNDQARQLQAGKGVLEQEMERVRRLNWTGLAEQTSWATRGYYDTGGNPAGGLVPGGFVSYIKVETLNRNGLSLAQTPGVDTTGGNSLSLRRVTICVQPTGVSVTAAPPTALAVTYVTMGGP